MQMKAHKLFLDGISWCIFLSNQVQLGKGESAKLVSSNETAFSSIGSLSHVFSLVHFVFSVKWSPWFAHCKFYRISNYVVDCPWTSHGHYFYQKWNSNEHCSLISTLMTCLLIRFFHVMRPSKKGWCFIFILGCRLKLSQYFHHLRHVQSTW